MSKFRLSKRNINLLIGLLVLLASGIYQIFQPKTQSITNQAQVIPTLIATQSAELFKVTKVIDGDTIQLENGQKVRYIGIDTPELHHPKKAVQCFGKEAMEKNKELIEGKIVRLEKDVSETDKYSRLLRYVYIPTDITPSGIFVNEYLVKEGYAYAATFPPDVKFADLFLTSQEFAEQNNLGLWNRCK